jgi:hypothetical protein
MQGVYDFVHSAVRVSIFVIFTAKNPLMRKIFLPLLILLLSHAGFGQQIHLVKKLDPSKIKEIRMDKRISMKTFDGDKFKGEWQILDEETILIQDKEVKKDNIMMISGYVQGNARDRGLGIGLTVGAGLVFPVAVYYFLGGIAWGFSNGIFVGATLLVFDLLLAYAGTTMMGIIPRRFSTLNWQIGLSTRPVPIPLPVPVD